MNEGHKFISLGYLVLPSLNKAFTYLLTIHPVSIPRLELCGAVLVVEAVKKILKEIDMEIMQVVYYTDSKVVLGYITNESERSADTKPVHARSVERCRE